MSDIEFVIIILVIWDDIVRMFMIEVFKVVCKIVLLFYIC